MPENKTEYLTIDQFFNHLKGEVISKKTKMNDGFTHKFAIVRGGSLAEVPVFKTEEGLEDFITKTFEDDHYCVYGIRDGKIIQIK